MADLRDARGMNSKHFDVIVVGAGIAGATCAAHLAPDRRVALLEAEAFAGYHTTGRSAALWEPNYGPGDVRVLTRLSRAFFEHPPAGFTDVPLTRRRAIAVVARAGEEAKLAAAVAGGVGLVSIDVAAVEALVPALRPGYAAAAALNDDAFDLDVAAIHQGFLRQVRAHGGTIALRHRAGRINRVGGAWEVETSTGEVFSAEIVVNAAGAWGDEVAGHAGVAPLGLVAKRRTGVIVHPLPWMPEDWPMLCDVAESWYCRPEARTRLMLSPADATPDVAHDVQAQELDIAIAIDRVTQALDIEISRVERAWAGLRTFAPDGSLAFGWDVRAEGFVWCVGQGGYGIQTSPAAGRLIADLVCGRDPGAAGAVLPGVDPARFATEDEQHRSMM